MAVQMKGQQSFTHAVKWLWRISPPSHSLTLTQSTANAAVRGTDQ